MISFLFLVYFLNFVVVLPGCILTWIFGLMIKGPRKIPFLILGAICTFLCVLSFVYRAQGNDYSTTVAIIGAAVVIPTMSTTIHTYKKRKTKVN